MSYAIEVKVLPATNTKPRRFKASMSGESKIYSEPTQDINPYDFAARQFADHKGLEAYQLRGAWLNNLTKIFIII